MTLPKSPSYLLKRPTGYYFRYAFSADLRPMLGHEVRRALSTSDLRQARRKAALLAAIVVGFCESARRKGPRADMRDELRTLLDKHLQDGIREAAEYTANLPPTEMDKARLEAEAVEQVASELTDALYCRDYGSAEQLAHNLLEDTTFEPPIDTREFRHFCRELLRVNIQLARYQAGVMRGGPAAVSKPVLMNTPPQLSNSGGDSKQQQRFSELLPVYLRQRAAKGVQDRSLKQYEGDLKLWITVMTDPIISDDSFSPESIVEAMETVKRLPPNRNKGEKKGKTIPALLEMGLPPMAENTYRRTVTRLSEFFNWAIQQRFMTYSPVKGMMPRKQTDARDERDAYTDEELRMLFDPARYLKASDPREKRTPYHYWVPVLSLMTGARLSEVTGLSVNDIEQTPGGDWVIHFRDNELGRELKSGTSSKRAVPLLPRILELGFIDYLNEVKNAGHRALFPDVAVYRGSWSHYPSKWFGRYKTRAGITERGKSAHSFRHTFITRLHHARLRESEIAQLVGHAQQGQTTGRYAKDLPPELMAQITAALDYPLDWEALKDGWRPMMSELPSPARERGNEKTKV